MNSRTKLVTDAVLAIDNLLERLDAEYNSVLPEALREYAAFIERKRGAPAVYSYPEVSRDGDE